MAFQGSFSHVLEAVITSDTPLTDAGGVSQFAALALGGILALVS